MSLLQNAWDAFESGDLDTARTLYETHLQSHPEDEQARFALGHVYVQLGLFEEAETLFQALYDEAAKAADPRAHQALHQLGMVRRIQGDYQGALEAFQQEKTLLPEDFFPRAINAYEMGMCHLRLGNLTEATTQLHSSLFFAQQSMDPIAQACAYRGIGELHLAQDSYAEAQPAFLEAIRCFEAAGDRRGVEDIVEYIKELEQASRG